MWILFLFQILLKTGFILILLFFTKTRFKALIVVGAVGAITTLILYVQPLLYHTFSQRIKKVIKNLTHLLKIRECVERISIIAPNFFKAYLLSSPVLLNFIMSY